MDENKKYHNPDDDGINNESDNDTYDPYEEYVKDKVHEEQKEEYGDSYARYTDPQMGPEDDRGRSYKPHHRRATNLEKIGFAILKRKSQVFLLPWKSLASSQMI